MCKSEKPSNGEGIFQPRLAACPQTADICCNKKDKVTAKPSKGCGFRNKNGVGYTLTNRVDEAEYAEFPWMAALLEMNHGGDYDYICGGSLIDENVVLTAAHCVSGKSADSLKVRLGEWDAQTTNEIFPHADHEVAKIIVHPEFRATNLFNDVALLVLKNPAKLSVHINTICLPPTNYRFDEELCFASGWGTRQFGQKDIYRVNLKKVELPVVLPRVCIEQLRKTRLGPRFRLDSSFMCAGGEKDIDTCTGKFVR
jgi:hypothetical protein